MNKNQNESSKIDRTIIAASLYLAAFEVLQNTVLDYVRKYFGVEQQADTTNQEYISQVLMLDDDLYISTCLWLLKHQAVSPEEFELLKQARYRREFISSQLPNIQFPSLYTDEVANIFDVEPLPKIELTMKEFTEMVDLVHKVAAWGTKNEYGLEDTDGEGILPVVEIFMLRLAFLAFPEEQT